MEVASDVISGVVVDSTGMKKVRVKFDDSMSNHCRDIRLPHFVTDKRITLVYAGHHIRPKRRTGVLPKN